jgi:hypothetical protein
VVLTVKPTSDQMPCLLAQGDRRRRVNLQHAPLHHETDPQADQAMPATMPESSQREVFDEFQPDDFDWYELDPVDRA